MIIKHSYVDVVKDGITGEYVYNLMVLVDKNGHEMKICHSTFRTHAEATEEKKNLKY